MENDPSPSSYSATGHEIDRVVGDIGGRGSVRPGGVNLTDGRTLIAEGNSATRAPASWAEISPIPVGLAGSGAPADGSIANLCPPVGNVSHPELSRTVKSIRLRTGFTATCGANSIDVTRHCTRASSDGCA